MIVLLSSLNKAWHCYSNIPLESLELLSRSTSSTPPRSSPSFPNGHENSIVTDVYKRSKEKGNIKDYLAKYLEIGIEDLLEDF